jgi:hypothetical protein
VLRAAPARERTLLASDARFKSLVQRATDIVTIMDADGR